LAYGTLSAVKERLGIDDTDTTHDTELNNALAYADGIIDAEFARIDETVPSTVPQAIKDASADFAAFYFLRNREPEKATTFYETGKMLLEKYIEGEYFKGVVKRTGAL